MLGVACPITLRIGSTTRIPYAFAVICYVMCYGTSALALDNPDAPDYVGEFLNRIKVYELAIQETAQTTQEYVSAYAEYEDFLDEELDKVYKMLMRYLDGDTQACIEGFSEKMVEVPRCRV